MNWIEIAAIVVLLLGIGAGGFLVSQRPSFWFGLGAVMFRAAWPKISAYITRRLPPEKEEEMRRCIRSGGKWDYIRKRCKR